MKVFSTIKRSFLLPDRPQEDYLFISKKYPIFVVADGVTLRPKKSKKYPNPSGAAKAAEIFCKTVISEAEKKYNRFEEQDLMNVVEAGNKAVADYNISEGRTKETINYLDFDLFSATTAFLLIKGKKAYWWSLCDSGVVILNKFGEWIFSSPSLSPTKGKFLPKGWNKMKPDKRAIIMHGYRNKLRKNGELLGYGVVDGEKEALNYLNFGVIDLNSGDLAIVYTDGFEHYLKLDKFNKIFIEWPQDLEQKLEVLMDKEIKNSRTKYGLERSLIAACID